MMKSKLLLEDDNQKNQSRGGTGRQSGAGRLLAGFDDPNDTGVIGIIGDLFQRLDSPPGLYVKETEKKDSRIGKLNGIS